MLSKLKVWQRDLTTTFLCKFYNWLGIDYPCEILPFKWYRNRIQIDSLLDDNYLYILRRNDLPIDETFDELGFVRDDSIEQIFNYEHAADMSWNLMGGKFQERHIEFNPKKSGSEIWPGGYTPILTNYKDNFEKKIDYNPIYIPLNGIFGQDYPYVTKDNEKRKKIKKSQFAPTYVEEGDTITTTGKLFVDHFPTVLNYWHVQLSLKDFDDEPVKKIRNAAEKLIGHAILQILTKHTVSKIDKPCDKISSGHYIN